jgi:hypothetical protein
MKRFLIPACALTLLAGCVDKDAREYAAKLSELLGSYQKQIEKRIQTEEKFYRDSAKDFRDEADMDVNRVLSIERDERSRELLAEMQEKGRAPSSALLQQRLRDYGNMDFDATRRLLERETTAEMEYLAGIQDLDGQAKSVKALNKALQELAKAPSTTDQLKQLQAFVTGVKTEIDRLDCADLKKALDQATGKKKSLEAKKKPLEATPERKEKNKLEIEKLGKQISALETSATDLTAQRTERGCAN